MPCGRRLVHIDDHPLKRLLRRLEQSAVLDEEDRRAVLALPYTLKSLDPSTYIVREGDPPLQCGVLLSGFAFRQKLTGDGLRQIIAVHMPGDAMDFQNLFLDVADHSVQMLTRGEVAFVARRDFQALARSRAGVGHAILINILIDASIFREWVLNVGRRDSRSRLAHVLCEFAVRLKAQGLAPEYGYELPMTQEQLADALGLTPVHVNRVLKALEAEGLISRNRRSVSFPDWERMRQVADFNERYLHLEPQRQASGPSPARQAACRPSSSSLPPVTSISR
ncbi:MAG: Crp/Fnr family transcriptional regulator [Alphaproteobacteria bacterium]|nr:Crp/Fnr family transcriptional regulator [Alphaproteobacteria bacterium]MBV9371296.1 Crp/Fnr family transcriptional regulator [Alphaproteobacteria bacterium]MBV9901760.1 Crp/Fnr family transcriptional regulator [Alphaproteobacteria bacterium]